MALGQFLTRSDIFATIREMGLPTLPSREYLCEGEQLEHPICATTPLSGAGRWSYLTQTILPARCDGVREAVFVNRWSFQGRLWQVVLNSDISVIAVPPASRGLRMVMVLGHIWQKAV
jgi:hypothetical protein